MLTDEHLQVIGKTLQEANRMTNEEMRSVLDEVAAKKKLDAKIPEKVTNPEVRDEIGKLIEKRDALDEKKKTEDAAFSGETKEKIDVLNEKILEKSKSPEAKAEEKSKTLEQELEELNAISEEKPIEKPSLEKDLEELAAKPATEENSAVEKPIEKEKPLTLKQQKSLQPVESRLDAEKRHSEDYQLYGEHEQGGLVKINDIGDMDGFADDQLYYLPKTESSVKGIKEVKTPDIIPDKVQSEESIIEAEKAAKLKEVGKPELKDPLKFIKEDLPTERAIRKHPEYAKLTIDRAKIKSEYDQIHKLIECLWG
jgi:hypothetical protein